MFPKVKSMFMSEITQHLPWALMAYIGGILIGLIYPLPDCFYCFLGLTAAAGFICFLTRQKPLPLWITMLIFFCLMGIANINFHYLLSKHSVLKKPLYQEYIEATISENRPLTDKQILTLTNIRWQNPDLKMPQKIRVHFKTLEPFLKADDTITAVVSVYPLNGISKQTLWFQKIAAVGVAEKINVLKSAPEKMLAFDEMRHRINRHLFKILPFPQAEVAAPLITGEQKLIRPETYHIYRQAGIAHVLSVSGFHMALLAAFLFFIIRSLCALFPRIVLYWNTKKIATLFALGGTFLYLCLSGFQIPAIRAFIMIFFVFMGILLDRSVLSMRSLILAAFGLLLFQPQMILSISFQLSFIAVAVLVMLCNKIQEQPWGKWKKIVVGFIGLNILVFLALMPFIAYHFHRITPYGILGNVLFNSVFTFFIMPLLFIGSLLMPFEADIPFFYLAGKGLDFVHYGAEKIAHLPYSEIEVPDFCPLLLTIIAFGILTLCFMKTPLKWAGSILIIFALILGLFP